MMKSRKGFVLLEAIIIIMIIALLAAIAIPSYHKAKRQSIENQKNRIAAALVEEERIEEEKSYSELLAPSNPSFTRSDTVIPRIPVKTALQIVAMGVMDSFTVYKIVDKSEEPDAKFYVVVSCDSNAMPQKIMLEKAE